MKYLKTDCATCGRPQETTYKNAYCIPDKAAPVVCGDCRPASKTEPAAGQHPVYYKTCDRDDCGVVTYRVELALAGRRVVDKKISQSACGGRVLGN